MKRISAKVDEYQDAQGQTKGRYVEIGAILTNDSGNEYVLLNPSISLAGVLIRQRVLNPQKAGKSVMCGVFEDEPAHKPPTSPQKKNEFEDDIPF